MLKLDFSYGTTNNNGNVLSQTITTPAGSGASAFTAVQTYTYDSLNRIKDAKEMIGATQTWKQTFNYDRYGNRTFDAPNTTTISSCPQTICNPTISVANNRFNSGQGYTYDLSGNVISDAEGRTFIYDGENKQKEVKNSSNVTVGTYFYDGDGKRVKKINSQSTTTFVYNASGKLVAEYSTLTPQTIPVTRYLTQDHLGSPRIITDQTGAVKSRRDFMPFGEEAFIGVGNRAVGHGYSYGDSTRQKFTGYERDEETGLDFAQARMYNKQLGRFTASDPLLSSGKTPVPQTWNRFAYVMNNPLRFVDPDGLCSKPSGLKKGQVGICFEAFIAAKRVGPGGFGHGDGRGFEGNDASKTVRIMVQVIISTDKKKLYKSVVTTISTSDVSVEAPINPVDSSPTRSGTAETTVKTLATAETKVSFSNNKTKVGESDFGDGVDVTISIAKGKNGAQVLGETLQATGMLTSNPAVYAVGKAIEKASPAGTIDGSVTLRITGGGNVTGVSAQGRPFPSYAAYSYTLGSDGKVQTRAHLEEKETPPVENLTKPIQPFRIIQ